MAEVESTKRRRLSITLVCAAAASATALVVCMISFVSLYIFERNLLQTVALRGQKLNFEIAQDTFSNLYNQGNWIHLEDFKNSFNKEPDVVYSYVVDKSGLIILGPDGYKSKFVGEKKMPWEPQGIEVTAEPKHIETQATSAQLLSEFPKLKPNARMVMLTFPMICAGNKEPCGERRHLVSFNSIESALNNLTVLFIIIGVGLTLMIGASVWWIVHRFLNPLRSLSGELKQISSPDLIDHQGVATMSLGDFGKRFLNDRTVEVADLQQSIFNFVRHQDKLHQLREQADVSKALSKLATQVLHDIRSPLAVLEGWSRNIEGIRENDRKILTGVVRRVRDIANSLAKVKKIESHDQTTDDSEESESCFIAALVEDIVSEKLVEFREHTKIIFSIHPDFRSETSLCVRAEPDELKRIISNVLNNSVEALKANSGEIEIGLAKRTEHEVEFYVKDNGKGIPANILPSLMVEGTTYDKPDGSGLGLFKAREVLKTFSGDIRLESVEGSGTTVLITLKRRFAPLYVVNHLAIAKHLQIYILDDDEEVHDLWKKRLVREGLDARKIFSSYNAQDFTDLVMQRKNLKESLFLIDHDLVGSSENGLQLIQKLHLQSRAILVTNRYDDALILKQIKALGCSLLPKSHIARLPLEIVDTQWDQNLIVLIDDEDFFRSYWRTMLTGAKKSFLDFNHREHLLAHRFLIPKDALIFIDVNITSTGDGLLLAHDLEALGFVNLYLCTGHEASELQVPSFIKQVISKELPNWLITERI